jgi:hypothetical protein
MIICTGDLKYEVIEKWAKWPKGLFINNTCQIEQNSKGIFYVLSRGEYPVLMLDKDGNFLGAWGRGELGWPHGLSITSSDCVWVTDVAWHTCRKYTADGKFLMELGDRGQPSSTGTINSAAYWEVQQAAGPFNQPTKAIETAWGDIYVTDGYGNARVHVFSSEGELKFSWGELGQKPGQFQLPHDILIDEQGIMYVAEMENLRVQLFSRDGKFMDQWLGIDRPAGMCRDKRGNFFLTELGEHNMRFKKRDYGRPLCKTPQIHILNNKGETLGYLGGPADVKLSEEEMCAPGRFATPHGCWVDMDDNLYVTEPVGTVIRNGRLTPIDCHTLQKFARIR